MIGLCHKRRHNRYPPASPTISNCAEGRTRCWRLKVKTAGTTIPNLGTFKNSELVQEQSTMASRPGCQLTSVIANCTVPKRKWRHQGHATLGLPKQLKDKADKEVNDPHMQQFKRITRQIDTHANIVGSDAVRSFKNRQGGLDRCFHRLPTYS